MFDFSSSELLFYGGFAAMIISVILAVIFTIFFNIKRQKLKRVLEQEYGKLQY